MRNTIRIVAGFAVAILFGAATGLPLLAQTPKDKSERPLQIGLQLYSVRDDCAKDLPGVLKAVSKMGYTGVEFAGYHGRSADDMRKLLDENKLKCYGTHLDVNALMGDNLDDHSNVFEKKSVSDRFAEVDRAKDMFGKRYIMLPNAIYGTWENALYDYGRLTELQKTEKRAAALELP